MDNRKVQLPKDYEYNLSDFTLFLSVMKNKEAYQCVLSIIMNQMDLELEEVKVEQVILNEKGLRAIRLDAWARDQENRQFNIEMQNDTSFLSRRMTYLTEIWPCIPLWRNVKRWRISIWMTGQRKFSVT